MLLSLAWLREFVPFEGTALELGDRLTSAGLELDGLHRPFDGLTSIVVGHVAECGRHPEADKLSVCRVDVGDEVLDIVCGAPNVAQGQKVAVVKVGCTLPGGLTIKKAKLRGAPSHGMICSEAELGLSEEHDGILVLPGEAAPGARLVDVLGLDMDVLDLSVTPNRGDCLSVLGMAREVAALYGLPLTLPRADLEEKGPDATHEVAIEADGALAPLYLARIIEGAVTRPSPDWMRYRLKAVGMRAISNLVDVTNYILMELGQPLHAFDLDAVRGNRIIVRGADAGERLVTLDGVERVLEPGDITIRDAERAIGLGGTMGGLNSEITPDSRRVFLECAVFNPSNIRKTARRLGLHSEASYRFERGVDQQGSPYALERAAALMAALSGGAVRPGVLGCEARPRVPARVRLRRDRAEKLIGVPLSAAFCEQTLSRLGCGVEPAADAPGRAWEVSPPSYRHDISREADCIEELARVYGVDNIPAILPALAPRLEDAGTGETLYAFLSRVKHWGRGVGLNEAVNYSFVSHRDLDHLELGPDAADGRISILNPLSDEQDTLRTVLAPGLLAALRNNLAQGAQAVRLFEVANTFTADAGSETTAREIPHLGILISGGRYPAAWPYPGGDLDYQDLKGLVDHLFHRLNLPAPEYAARPLPHLSPGLAILAGDAVVGHAGKLRPKMADAFHARKDVWLAELDLAALYALHGRAAPRFVPLAVFPPVRRDITFIAPPEVTADSIIRAVVRLNLPLLEDVRLIDYFEPEGSREKNLTFRLTFRHAERTLKDKEADKQRDAVAGAIPRMLGVRV